MKIAFFSSLTCRLVLALGFVLTLAACAAPTASPVTPEMATIRGSITYQGMPTPASILYFISPDQWYSLEVPSASPAATFEYQLPAGSYQIIAFPVGSQDQAVHPAAAYSDSGTAIDFLKVTAGQVVEDIRVRNINSDRCISVPFPASPDGRFPAIEATCN